MTDGVQVTPREKWNRLVTFPLFSIRGLDFSGLRRIRAQVVSLSKPWRIHLHPGTDNVFTVRSSKKALMGGCLTPDLVSGPLHSGSADLTSMFMAKEKRLTEIVHW